MNTELSLIAFEIEELRQQIALSEQDNEKLRARLEEARLTGAEIRHIEAAFAVAGAHGYWSGIGSLRDDIIAKLRGTP